MKLCVKSDELIFFLAFNGISSKKKSDSTTIHSTFIHSSTLTFMIIPDKKEHLSVVCFPFIIPLQLWIVSVMTTVSAYTWYISKLLLKVTHVHSSMVSEIWNATFVKLFTIHDSKDCQYYYKEIQGLENCFDIVAKFYNINFVNIL